MSLESSIREAALDGAREAFHLEVYAFLDQFHGVFIRPDDDVVLTLTEAAVYLRLDEKTVRALIESDKISAVKAGGQWRIGKWALRRYLDPNLVLHGVLEQNGVSRGSSLYTATS
jgi:excisionase family DNA binding protein